MEVRKSPGGRLPALCKTEEVTFSEELIEDADKPSWKVGT